MADIVTKRNLHRQIFTMISKGRKSFGTKQLGDLMRSFGMKPNEIELMVNSFLFYINVPNY